MHGQSLFYFDRKCPFHRSEVATIAKEAPKRPRRRPMPLLTLGQAVAARVRLIVWCRACQHHFDRSAALLAILFVMIVAPQLVISAPREYDKRLALQLHVPATITDLRKFLGKELEFDQQTRRYHWEMRTHIGTVDYINAWGKNNDPMQIEAIHIGHGAEFWLIDRNDRHCAPDHFAVWICSPGFPSF